MAAFQTLKFIMEHPLTSDNKIDALIRYIKVQLQVRVTPYPIVYPFLGDNKIIVKKGLTGALFSVYTGLHEFIEMCFVLHFLNKSDYFVDIGANVGTYSILTSGLVNCRTLSIEPVPSTYKYLKDNICVNDASDLVKALNLGLGSKKGQLKFTDSFDTINHVTQGETGISVSIEQLDDVVEDMPSLIKLDVEGFETEVLKGGENTLSSNQLEAIIIELNESGKRYGYQDKDIHKMLQAHGFFPCSYDPYTRNLSKLDNYIYGNNIYIKDLDRVNLRLQSGIQITLGNKKI